MNAFLRHPRLHLALLLPWLFVLASLFPVQSSAFDDFSVYTHRTEVYGKADAVKKRVFARLESRYQADVKKLGSSASKAQLRTLRNQFRAKAMLSAQRIDKAAASILQGRESLRLDRLAEGFAKAGVKMPAMTGTPASKTSGIGTDVDFSNISKADAKKVYKAFEEMFGPGKVIMRNGTIDILPLETTAFYPEKAGRFAPYSFDNPEIMHYYEKHAPHGNSAYERSVRSDYVYDNTKKIHDDLTVKPKELLKNPDRLRNASKAYFRQHGATGGGSTRLSGVPDSGVPANRAVYKDSKKLRALFEQSLQNGRPIKLSTLDQAILISKEKMSAEAVGLYGPDASEADKLKAIGKYQKNLKKMAKESYQIAQHWDDYGEQVLMKQYQAAQQKGQIKKANLTRQKMMEWRARRIRAKLGVMRNRGGDLLAEFEGLQVGRQKVLTDPVKKTYTYKKTYYDPKTGQYLNQGQLQRRIIDKDWKSLNRLCKMDESALAKTYANTEKPTTKTIAPKGKVAKVSKRAKVKLRSKWMKGLKSTAAGAKKLQQKVMEKLGPQLQSRAAFSKTLGWVGFLATLPQATKDAERLTKSWITEDDTTTTVFLKHFASLSAQASGAKPMFDLLSSEVEERVNVYRQAYPEKWAAMSFDEKVAVRRRALIHGGLATVGKLGKGMLGMPKVIANNYVEAWKQGSDLVNLKSAQWASEKTQEETKQRLKDYKTQVALRGRDARLAWKKVRDSFEKRHGKDTRDYQQQARDAAQDPKADTEELLDMAYGQELADEIEKARRAYRDARKAAGGKANKAVTDAFKRFNQASTQMQDFIKHPNSSRKSARSQQNIARYEKGMRRMSEQMAALLRGLPPEVQASCDKMQDIIQQQHALDDQLAAAYDKAGEDIDALREQLLWNHQALMENETLLAWNRGTDAGSSGGHTMGKSRSKWEQRGAQIEAEIERISDASDNGDYRPHPQGPSLDEIRGRLQQLQNSKAIAEARCYQQGFDDNSTDSSTSGRADGGTKNADGTVSYASTRMDSGNLDYCLSYGTDCGQPAADAWCQQQGFSSATSFEVSWGSPPTVILSTGEICDGAHCDQISSVTCDGKPFTPPSIGTDNKAPSNTITVQSAVYGMSKTCNATSALADQCNDKANCSFSVGNHLCGDPEFGVVKRIKVSYQCTNGGAKTQTAQEYESMTLSCE